MDNKMKNLKKEYESLEIPWELEKVVKESLNNGKKKLYETSQGDTIMNEINKKRKSMYKKIGAVAAALVVMVGAFGVSVNTSSAFAATVSDIPVLGTLAKVFTIESSHEETDVYVADMKIPGIEGLKDKELQKEINKLVYTQVNAAVDQTKIEIAEAKQAWLDTGGKEADYVPMEIAVDYEVKTLTEDTLSFSVYKTQTLASAYFEMFYYNYDLNTGKMLTLEKILGSDYMNIANKQIKDEIAVRSLDENSTYWDGTDQEPAFETIAKDQQFYVNRKGNPVIVFNKYEIAPGFMGIQEFEIVK